MAALRYNRGPGGAKVGIFDRNGRGQRIRGRGFKIFRARKSKPPFCTILDPPLHTHGPTTITLRTCTQDFK